MIVGALTFRNTYASQPYLPDELIPVDHKKVGRSLLKLYFSWDFNVLLTIPQPFFSIDLDMKWPELSSCIGELGSCGELIIRSEEGRAVLILGPSGQEFSVKYTCCLSRSHDQKHSTEPGKKPVDVVMRQRAAAAARDTKDGHLESTNMKFLSLTSNVQPKVRVLKFPFV